MDPRTNPYSPGAGTRPPELAGRDEVLEKTAIALDRIRTGYSARSSVLYGLRGVGKTVLLNEIRREAEARGIYCAHIEVPENRSLPSVLIPSLRQLLLTISAKAKVKDVAQSALRVLAGFSKIAKVKFHDVEVMLDLPPVAGKADSGDFDFDLRELLEEIALSAQANDSSAVLFIDELQYVEDRQLEALITAMHSLTQKQLPITLVGAGLPQLLGKMGKAKSYSERLFEYEMIDRLAFDAARDVLKKPADSKNILFETGAIEYIVAETQGYPYFLQEWGKHAWDIAEGSTITTEDARNASPSAIAALDRGFFRVRYDRLTRSEKAYMQAMAYLGPGPYRSNDIAAGLGKKINSVGPDRSNLIAKGMVYSPAHGDVAFTVPMFDGYLKRIMPR